MTDNAVEEIENIDTGIDIDSIDNETPSTIKSGFQRWLIVAGVLFCFLFLYLFMQLSKNEKKIEAEKVKEEVPQSLTEAKKTNTKSVAVKTFEESFSSNQAKKVKPGEKQVTSNINRDYAPRKNDRLPIVEDTSLRDSVRIKEKSPYQKFAEEEQTRALKSLSSKDTIGNKTGFYKTNKPVERIDNNVAMMPREKKLSVQQRQEKIRDKIKAITKYRQAIESGQIDATQTPPNLQDVLGDDQ